MPTHGIIAGLQNPSFCLQKLPLHYSSWLCREFAELSSVSSLSYNGFQVLLSS
jgi:hypothetical protein